MPGPDYIVDLSHRPQGENLSRGAAGPLPGRKGRPWLAIHWKCCNVYGRVYRNRGGDAYEGRCPHCGRRVTAIVGPGGTTSRFFIAQ